jgi:hypothetical protein
MSNVAIDLIASKTGDKLSAFAEALKERKPMLSDLTDWLYDFRMAFGDVDFDTFLKALTTAHTPILTPEPKRGGKELRKELVVFLAGKSAVSFRDLCKNCGKDMSEQNVRYHLNGLIECGAVEQVERGFYSLAKSFGA